MGRVVALRVDFDGPSLRGLAKTSKDSNQSRRLLALAEIYDGGRRKDAVWIGAVGLQLIRDWVFRFNAKGPAGLMDGKATGKPPKLYDAQRQALARIVESGPIPAVQAWCAGVGRIWHFGYTKSMASRLRNLAWAVS